MDCCATDMVFLFWGGWCVFAVSTKGCAAMLEINKEMIYTLGRKQFYGYYQGNQGTINGIAG